MTLPAQYVEQVSVTVKRPSVGLSICLSHRSTSAAACGGFAAERPPGRRYRSIAGAGAKQERYRSTALGSKCGQCHADSRRTSLTYVLLRRLRAHSSLAGCRPVWARERCRISPPRFLAECCKRQLNQGSFALLYLGCLLFPICIEFVCIFLYCFVCQYQSSDWL